MYKLCNIIQETQITHNRFHIIYVTKGFCEREIPTKLKLSTFYNYIVKRYLFIYLRFTKWFLKLSINKKVGSKIRIRVICLVNNNKNKSFLYM